MWLHAQLPAVPVPTVPSPASAHSLHFAALSACLPVRPSAARRQRPLSASAFVETLTPGMSYDEMLGRAKLLQDTVQKPPRGRIEVALA